MRRISPHYSLFIPYYFNLLASLCFCLYLQPLTVNLYIPPAEPMIAYPIDFSFNFESNEYTYGENTHHSAYGFSGYNSPQGGGGTYGSGGGTYSGSYNGGYNSGYDGYQNPSTEEEEPVNTGGRIAIRGSSYHDFARCESAHVLSTFLGDQDLGLFPTPTTTTPIFSWFKVDKVPTQIVRRMLENYQAAVSGGIPRTFLIFTSAPFTDRIDALHYHGAEAQLSSRRVVLGQMRIVARATKLEQQATVVISNAVSDAISFSFDVGLNQAAVLEITDFPFIDFGDIFPVPPVEPPVVVPQETIPQSGRTEVISDDVSGKVSAPAPQQGMQTMGTRSGMCLF